MEEMTQTHKQNIKLRDADQDLRLKLILFPDAVY